MDINARIEKVVEGYREEALSLLQSLVQIPSLAGHEKPCQDIVASKMKEIELEVDVFDPPDEELKKHQGYVPVDMSYKDRPNVVGTYHGEGGGKSLILNGHIDVVPIGPESYWTYSPWSGTYIDGKVYGRGSSDMKAGVVSNLIAVQVLKSMDIKLKGDLIVESVVDEELGGNGTLACVMRGYKADGWIFTEPSGLGKIGVSNRGAQYFRIIVPGIEGGTEYKHDLVNPIQKAMEVFQAVEAYSIMRESTVSHPLYNSFYNTKVPLGICVINGGELPSTVSSQCVMEGTIECLPNEDIQKVKADFKAYLDEWGAKDPWFKNHPIKLEWFGLWFESAEIAPENPLAVNLAGKVKAFLNKTPMIAGAGGCDLRIPIKYGNTPAVLFGPSGGKIHSVDEYVDFEEVMSVVKILVSFAIDWCGI